MASLAEKIKEIGNSKGPGLPCGVGKIISELDGEDKSALEMLMSSKPSPNGISNRLIFSLLDQEGYKIAFASVRLHRSKMCRCFIGKNSSFRNTVEKQVINKTSSSNKKRRKKTK